MQPIPVRFARYGSADVRPRVEGAYLVFHTWRSDHEERNRIYNVTQTIAFLDHETEWTVMLVTTGPEPRFVGLISVMVQEPEGFLRNRVAPQHWICNVLVHPQHRKRGYASRLLEHAEEHLRGIGATIAHLWCEPGLQSFYEKRGWEKKGNFEAKPGTVHMTKTLLSSGGSDNVS